MTKSLMENSKKKQPYYKSLIQKPNKYKVLNRFLKNQLTLNL